MLFRSKRTAAPQPPTPAAVNGPASQKTQIRPAAVDEMPASADFKHDGNRLICVPNDILEKETNHGKKYVAVALNGSVGQHTMAFCRHGSLWNALTTAKGKRCRFEIEITSDGKYLTISDVLDIDGVKYREGKTFDPFVAEQKKFEITDDDIPF